MKIKDILASQPAIFSFEFFPPKDEAGFEQLFETIENLKPWNPGYVSVTYGAGGSTRQKTVDLVCRIKRELGIESMAHLTCVGSTAKEIGEVLDLLDNNGIQNILPLRGDPPKGSDKFVRTVGGFANANELVRFIHEKGYDFCLGVAGYPEGHQECVNMKTDLGHLKQKVDSGADFVITQLFFDNRHYFGFLDQAKRLGIKVPILPGIMPIINLKQIQWFTKMCGATIPQNLVSKLESVQDDPESVRSIGVQHATEQCEELLLSGVSGIHFYTLNKSNSTLRILENIKNLVNT